MAGYSGTPLAKKLGIKPGARLHVFGAPAGYAELLAPLPEGATLAPRLESKVDLAQIFVVKRSGLEANLHRYRRMLADGAILWVSWPKKASGVATEITEDLVRELALPLGYVDVKVCAIDDVWSGLKLVVRKELRKPK